MSKFIALIAVLFFVLLTSQGANADADLDNKCINAAGFESDGAGIAWSRIKTGEAIDICTTATSQPDATGPAWAALGRVLYKRDGCDHGTRKCERTKHALLKAISLKSAEGYVGLGILYEDHIGYREDNLASSLALYRRSVEIEPLGHAHYRIYEILLEKADDEWREHLAKAVALKNEHATAILGQYYVSGRHGYQKDVKKGMALLEKAVDLGRVRALTKLGDLYYYGDDVPEDKEKAATYFRKAVEQESGYGAYSLASIYRNGDLGTVDRKQAEKYYLLGHKWGNCNDPLTELGDTYFERQGTVVPDYASAAKWYQNAVYQGESAALLKLTHMHRNGFGVPQNDEIADELASKYGLNLYYLSALLDDREDLSVELQDEIIFFLQKAADGGDANAYSMLIDAYRYKYGSLHDTADTNIYAAKAYLLSLTVKSDEKFPIGDQPGTLKAPVRESFELLTWLKMRMILRKMRRAGLFPFESMKKYKGSEIARYLDLKSNDLMREKRIAFLKGPGLGRWTTPTDKGFYPGQAYYNIASTHYNAGDKEKSFQWMRRCASAGHPVCVANIASMHVYGDGLDKDLNRAREWIDKNSNSKSGYVLATFGELIESGNLGPVDTNKAVEYYRRSAELGHPKGQSNLAYMYSKGLGIEKDWERALHWYTKAAEQGQGRGIYGVGVAYDNGYQVARNKTVANEHFIKSAKIGYPAALKIVEQRGLKVE